MLAQGFLLSFYSFFVTKFEFIYQHYALFTWMLRSAQNKLLYKYLLDILCFGQLIHTITRHSCCLHVDNTSCFVYWLQEQYAREINDAVNSVKDKLSLEHESKLNDIRNQHKMEITELLSESNSGMTQSNL